MFCFWPFHSFSSFLSSSQRHKNWGKVFRWVCHQVVVESNPKCSSAYALVYQNDKMMDRTGAYMTDVSFKLPPKLHNFGLHICLFVNRYFTLSCYIQAKTGFSHRARSNKLRRKNSKNKFPKLLSTEKKHERIILLQTLVLSKSMPEYIKNNSRQMNLKYLQQQRKVGDIGGKVKEKRKKINRLLICNPAATA